MPPPAPTVCIIEDDTSVCRALWRLIRSWGLDVATFASAEAFLEAVEPPTPVCLILDLHLPRLSGLEMQARLQAEGRTIPTVFITASAEPPVRDQALRTGALAFLEKPLKEEDLRRAVNRALRESLLKEV
jgi:FixJ family two-component response regulator